MKRALAPGPLRQGCRVVAEELEAKVGRGRGGMPRSHGPKGEVREFASIRAWLDHARALDADEFRQGAGKGGGGDAWECVHLGSLSLRECAQMYAAGVGMDVEGGQGAGERGGTGEAWDLEIGAEGVDGEERSRLAMRVRLNELGLLEHMHQWIGECEHG